MDVNRAAEVLGVTPRRVRALIASNRIAAHKVGGVWEVTDLGTGVRRRRPLSATSREDLSRALHYRSLAGLTGQHRARTATRIRELRGSDDAAQLLVDWWGGVAPDVVNYAASLVQLALAGKRAEVTESVRRPRREYLRQARELADVVSTERTIHAMTVRQLADAASVSVEQVRRIERAEPVDSPAVIRRILRAVEVEPTALPDMVLA